MTIQDASLTTVAKDSKIDQLGVVGQAGASEVVLPTSEDDGSVDNENDKGGSGLQNMKLNTQSEIEVATS